MNKILARTLLIALAFGVALFLVGCNTPFDQIVSASTHFQGAQLSKVPTGLNCPSKLNAVQSCTYVTQTLIPDSGKNLPIPVQTYPGGYLTLLHAKISKSSGLTWYDPDGNAVTIDQMVQNVQYTFVKTESPAGFVLDYAP